ncbi:MAG: site-specific DNA-methyltransferase [Alphaproteobacteria bacterium]|nr:site-specific DNA-methyltransferase [Alphaproteobacteria bacterium]
MAELFNENEVQAKKDNEPEEINVDGYKFHDLPPIKGFPELRWRGKVPYKYTRFFPAQLKETYGQPDDSGWMNKIFWGDNLQVMSHLLKKYRGKIDLVYIDPPFDSKADYKKTIELRGKKATNDHTAFEEKQYGDMWNNDEYLQFMYERLILIRELLSDKGSVYLHCDWHKVHHLRCLMDEVLGPDNFRNEIIWTFGGKGLTNVKNNFARNYNSILFYTKTNEPTIHLKDGITSDSVMQRFGKYLSEDGKIYFRELRNSGEALELEKATKSFIKNNGREPLDTDVARDYSSGSYIKDVWSDIPIIRQNDAYTEYVGYPTQKPEALLEKIVKASSDPNDIVFDCFMGSGTTQTVAMKLGRRFIGADINLGAVETTVKRLVQIQKDTGLLDNKQPGFEVYNVNNYDVFRNPVEARDILIDALEINRLGRNTVFDGEKDGFMVKVMPVNRIANSEDLNEIINGIDQASLEAAQAKDPNKPAMNIRLVCMGHEPDLGAKLKAEIKKQGFDVNVEVYDILRNDKELEFKHPSEANIVKEGNKLVIQDFFPMNLLQKLSIQKENVENWKELVESVKIDWNYDGAVFQPAVIDYPEDKKDMVKGVYDIPADVGIVRIKITDLLSESFETELDWSK